MNPLSFLTGNLKNTLLIGGALAVGAFILFSGKKETLTAKQSLSGVGKKRKKTATIKV